MEVSPPGGPHGLVLEMFSKNEVTTMDSRQETGL